MYMYMYTYTCVYLYYEYVYYKNLIIYQNNSMIDK